MASSSNIGGKRTWYQSETSDGSVEPRESSGNKQPRPESSEPSSSIGFQGSTGAQQGSSSFGRTDENEMIITSIRATDVAFGLRRLPAGFLTVVHHSGFQWRTENRHSSVNDDVVEWSGPIPIPSDLLATICLVVYASFEFHPMLGTGELLRKLTITVEQLLDHSENGLPFTFSLRDGDIVSPCSSIVLTVERRKREDHDSSTSRALGPHSPALESRGELEDATDHGHNALSRYRKYRVKRDLERSIGQFERALNVCPVDHPCRAAAQSNLAMARLILCQVEATDASLEVALRLYRNALSARPVGHPDRPSTLIHLAAVHFVQSQRREDHVEEGWPEALLQEAMELSSADSHEKRAAILIWQLHVGCRVASIGGRLSTEQDSASRFMDEDPWILGVRLLERFEQFGELADLQEAITMLEESVRSSSIGDDRYRAGAGNLGVALSYRFEHLGELNDLEEAISKQRHATDLTPDGHPDKPAHLNNLGASFRIRFQRLGELRDLECAISVLMHAVNLIPIGHPDKPGSLNNLGTCFFARFERLGELRDLEDAISKQRDAVDLTPHGHRDKPVCLNNLGTSLRVRFKRFGQLSDLEDAVSTLRVAVDLTPHGHPDKPARLNNLGISCRARFERLGCLSDLEDAISMLRSAVELTPHGHPDQPTRLDNLGSSFRIRFGRLGQLNDLEDAILTLSDAANLTPPDHPDKSACLDNLGTSFRIRFGRLGQLSDLEDAISTLRGAVALTPPDHPDKPARLENLGTAFRTRFERLGELSDLENAISVLQSALDLTAPGHPDKPARLSNLGTSHRTRFERFGELSDLEDAISMLTDAVEHTPLGHPDRPARLTDLGNSFRTRFERLGELRDLEESILTLTDAVDLTARSHPAKPIRLDSLGTSFRTRFKRFGELHDIEDAISTLKDAVGLTPPGHSDKPARLSNLGHSFRTRFEHLGELGNLEQAISLYSHAASASIGPVNVRFSASQDWISCALRVCHRSLLHAYSVAIHLLPQLAWIGLSLTQRYSQLARGADVVREAAAAALDSGFPETAVEWLEQGRSIVWGELFQLRNSFEELWSTHPDHARRLQELSAALDHASIAREQSLSTLSGQTRDPILNLSGISEHASASADRHRALAIQRDELLQEIRRLPGFGKFLLRKQYSQLRTSAHSGPVVILNAAVARCDALIVFSDLDHVIHVPLPHFTLRRSFDLQNTLNGFIRHGRAGSFTRQHGLSWEYMLPTLWQSVVKPVLDQMAVSTPGELSRVFWCPTGSFAFLPIHAAGIYNEQYSEPGHKVFDFVVSSYVPNLSILGSSNPSTSGNLRLLAVPQPPTDGLDPLPGVRIELEHIKEVVKNSPSTHITLLEPSVCTVEEVLGLMKESDWVHFACHGAQDGTDSGLCLADGRRLKLHNIIGLSRPRGGLAFLSACQTATGEKDLSDEAIHMAAGMLFAGYGGVIGTMWSINDRLASDVAKAVYVELFRDSRRPDHREAAWALHKAIRNLRDRDVPFVEWVPFIHVGL